MRVAHLAYGVLGIAVSCVQGCDQPSQQNTTGSGAQSSVGGEGGTSSSSSSNNSTSSSSGMAGAGGMAGGANCQVEICGNGVDEDCDGADCNFVAAWSRRFGDDLEQRIEDFELGTDGSLTLVGSYNGTLMFDNAGTLIDTHLPNFQPWLAKIDANGTAIAAQKIAEQDMGGYAQGLALDAQGNQFVVGLDFSMPVAAFLRKFNANHMTLWNTSFGTGGNIVLTDVQVGATGKIVTAGWVSGTGTFACTKAAMYNTPFGDDRGFIAGFDAQTGQCEWATVFSGGISRLNTVEAAGNGRFLISGEYYDNFIAPGVNFPQTTGTSTFVLDINSDGTIQWGKAFTTDGSLQFTGLHWNEKLQRILATFGLLGGTAQFDNIMIQVSPGDYAAILLALDANGSLIWHRKFQNADFSLPESVTSDPDGNVYWLGSSYGPLPLEPNGPPVCETSGHFWAKHDGLTGAPLFGQCIDRQMNFLHSTSGQIKAGANRLVIGLTGDGLYDFGNGLLMTAGDKDLFLAQYLLKP